MKYEYVSSSTLAGTKDEARIAENAGLAGVVNILATPTTTAGSVSMSRNLILVHIEKLKLMNTMYKLKSREGMMWYQRKWMVTYALAAFYNSQNPVIARRSLLVRQNQNE